MRLIAGIRERVGAVIAAAIAALCFLIMGAIMTFVVSPQQALEWRRIENLPQLTADSYLAAPAGEEVVITGTLEGNQEFNYRLVAYDIDRWNVTPPEDDETDPDGTWVSVERVVPALMINFQGTTITTTADNNVTFGGSMAEFIEDGPQGGLSDTYDGQRLNDGALRTQGFSNGNLVTVAGLKASTGDLIPDRLFGGDRVQLVESIRSGARFAFIGGIVMMICSPVVLVLGVLGAAFGRRRQGIV